MNTTTCIIGGGVSGLKAAHHLLNHPDSKFSGSDIILLEAQSSLGGRIKTDRSSSVIGNHYDLGALWFHDSLTNLVLNELLKDPDFDFERDTEYNDQDPLVLSEDGIVDLSTTRLNKVIEDLEKFIEIHFFNLLNVKDVLLKEIIQVFMEEYNERLTVEQKKYAPRLMRYLELWYGIAWDTISGKYSIMDHQGRNLFNKMGYDKVISMLVGDLPNERLFCNQKVVVIDRTNKSVRGSDLSNLVANTLEEVTAPSALNEAKRIRIETAQGLVVYCDYVIVTVPQSVLNLPAPHEFGIKWVPELPKRVVSAIESVHFAALGKVIFEFDEQFWPKRDSFQILASEKAGDSDVSKRLLKLPDSFTYPAYVVSLKNALCILTQDPLTSYLEEHSEEAWKYFEPMLATLSERKIPQPINTILSDWTRNPYIRGSYTCLHTGDDGLDLIIQLSGDVDIDGVGLVEKWVRFAGEHTVLDGAGCVHGAWNSGVREAEWIIQQSAPSI